MDKHHQGSRLRALVKKLDYTQDEMGVILGMTRQNLNYHFRKPILDENFVRLIKEKLGFVSLDYGFSNKPALKGEGTPVYELSATAGSMDNINQLPEAPSFHVNVPGYEDCNFGIYVYGHSMYPTIETGSLILCRKVSDKSVIMPGEVYLLRTGDYLMVKRLQKAEKKGSVLCTSDNFEQRSKKFRRFESFSIELDKIIDLYLVKGIIKKTQS